MVNAAKRGQTPIVRSTLRAASGYWGLTPFRSLVTDKIILLNASNRTPVRFSSPDDQIDMPGDLAIRCADLGHSSASSCQRGTIIQIVKHDRIRLLRCQDFVNLSNECW